MLRLIAFSFALVLGPVHGSASAQETALPVVENEQGPGGSASEDERSGNLVVLDRAFRLQRLHDRGRATSRIALGVFLGGVLMIGVPLLIDHDSDRHGLSGGSFVAVFVGAPLVLVSLPLAIGGLAARGSAERRFERLTRVTPVASFQPGEGFVLGLRGTL